MLLRCYAEQREGGWEALCLDLDIAAQGDTFEDTYRELRGAVDQYLEYVRELPEAEQPRFLNRKAPLSLRLKFMRAALGLAFIKPRDRGGRAEFTLPAAA